MESIEFGFSTTGMSTTRSRDTIQIGAKPAHLRLLSAFNIPGKVLRIHKLLHIIQPLLDQLVTIISERDASTVRLADVAFHFRLNQFEKLPGTRSDSRRWSRVAHVQIWSTCIISSIERPRHRHRKDANLSHPHHRPEIKPRPLRLYMRSTLSGASLILLRWMERQRRGHASETTTTTSQHDGTTCTCVHTMNNPTPVI